MAVASNDGDSDLPPGGKELMRERCVEMGLLAVSSEKPFFNRFTVRTEDETDYGWRHFPMKFGPAPVFYLFYC